jgi:uncharacterized iron-regulated membrane protein
MRRIWLIAHRWLALALGLPLLAVALLGSTLVVLKPVDRWLNAELFTVPAGAAAPHVLEQARLRLRTEFGPAATLVFRPPREPGESLRVTVRAPSWDGAVYIDPRDGRELGRRGRHEGAFNLVFEIHSSLLMNEAGKPLLATLALAYFVLLAGGLVLWWPRRWSQAWSLTLNRGRLRGLFDLHRSGGSVLGLLIAIPVATGAYMAWKPLSQTLTSLSGQPVRAAPKVRDSHGLSTPITLDDMVARASVQFGGVPAGYVQVPADISKPVRVRLKLADDPHPNGLTSVWMHPQTGEVLRTDRWNELDIGAKANSIIYPLHTGELGGVAHQAANAVLGLALAALAGAGLWLWWLRRLPKRR